LKENEFEDNVGALAFGIRMKNRNNLVEKCIDFEYMTICYNFYCRNKVSIPFPHGIAYMIRRKLFEKLIEINPSGGILPFGEDGYMGLICRLNGFRIKQDFKNFFLSFCPNKLFYGINDFKCKSKKISGYDSTNIYKQRALRWFRSGTARLPFEIYSIFTTKYNNSNDGIINLFFKNIYYGINILWKNILLYFAISTPFLIYNKKNNIQYYFLLLLLLYIFSIFSIIFIKYVTFKNRNDLRSDFIIIFIYPFFVKYNNILKLMGFISTILYYIPFEVPIDFYSCKNYKINIEDIEKEINEEKELKINLEKIVIKEEIKEKEIELEKIIIK
jgi:hypothetical protein